MPTATATVTKIFNYQPGPTPPSKKGCKPFNAICTDPGGGEVTYKSWSQQGLEVGKTYEITYTAMTRVGYPDDNFIDSFKEVSGSAPPQIAAALSAPVSTPTNHAQPSVNKDAQILQAVAFKGAVEIVAAAVGAKAIKPEEAEGKAEELYQAFVSLLTTGSTYDPTKDSG